MEEADNADLNATMDPPDRPSLACRKSSFSETLNKFAANPFNRRHTVASVPTNTAAPSRLPTLFGIARSTSFFSNLNACGSDVNASGSALGSSSSLASIHSSNSFKKENQQPISKPVKFSTRFAQTPFFTQQASAPVTPIQKQQPRESTVQIKQHHLMAPIGPPLPRSKTMGSLQGDLSSTTSFLRTPSYARPTSSSAARRNATLGAMKENQALTPTPAVKKTPTTTSSGKARSGTPHPRHTPASTSSGKARVAAAMKASETPTPTAAGTPKTRSSGKARVSFADAKEILEPIAAGPLESQAKAEDEVVETPTPTTGSSDMRATTNLKQELEEALLATAPGQVPAPEHAEKEIDEDDARGATPIPQNPRHIHTAMPAGYWGGRLVALSDRFRTEELQDSSSFHRVGSMHDDGRRMRRVFIHLNSLCQSEEAKESLAAFKEAYENRLEDEQSMEGERIVKEKGKGKAVVADDIDDVDIDDDDEEEEAARQKKKGSLLGKFGKNGKKERKKSGGW